VSPSPRCFCSSDKGCCCLGAGRRSLLYCHLTAECKRTPETRKVKLLVCITQHLDLSLSSHCGNAFRSRTVYAAMCLSVESPSCSELYKCVGRNTRRLCCHSARPGQTGELGAEEPDEIQQGQVQGPAPGEEQPHAPVQARGRPAGEVSWCGEGPACPGG